MHRIFPLTTLPFDLLQTVLFFIIKHQDSKASWLNLLYVNRTFARAVVPHIWQHIFIIEPTQHTLLSLLQQPQETLTFDYASLVQSVTICPISISNMKPGGLLHTLRVIQDCLPNLKQLHVEDKLAFCHVCHLGKEATTWQVASLLCLHGLKEFRIDSNHSTFNDELLGIVMPHLAGGLETLALSGENFTDYGIIEYVIPMVGLDLVEFSAGVGGLCPVSITGTSILALLACCPNLRRMELEGLRLTDEDFMVDRFVESRLEHLSLGKTRQLFSSCGLSSLLSTCHKSLISLILDLDHVNFTVLQDVLIPLFRGQNLQRLAFVSDSWATWTAHYPQPRYEDEVRAKEAMLRWRMKAYWGLSNEIIKLVGERLESLKSFTILGANHLNRTIEDVNRKRAILSLHH